MARTPRSETVSTLLDELQTRIAYLEQRIVALEALQEVALIFSSELQLNRLLALILSSAVDVMKASAGSLLLYDEATKELVFQVVQGGGGKALRQKRIRCDEGIAGWVFSRGQPVIVQDTAMDPRHLVRIDEALRFHTARDGRRASALQRQTDWRHRGHQQEIRRNALSKRIKTC
jgi:putative methionine-R-sulfoxide reductase with GAF domain